VKAEIIAIGTELLLGEIVDTDSPYLASQLPPLGVDLYFISGVGDNPARLAEVLGRAWGRSDLILLSGGLGPTEDDITREAVARFLGEEMKVDPALENGLRELFASRGLSMPPRNIKQATLIPSARPLPNPLGTAPGWWVERENRLLIALPGPPDELQRMWEKEVLPRLKTRLGQEVLLTRTLKTFGLPEAVVDEALAPFLSSPHPTMGIYVRPDGIHIRLAAKGRAGEAREALDKREAEVRRVLGEKVWGVDEDTLEGVVGRLLVERGLTLATMESLTGGLLAHTITNVPGSSRYFLGGIVAYSNQAKIQHGVKSGLIEQFGAVSPQVAQAMAGAVRRALGADVGLATTGVAGPDPLEGKPPGTVHIGLDLKDKTSTIPFTYLFDRLRIKRMAVNAALFHLRKALLEAPY
jgi:nicotinamide-nucleotide amidase